MNRRGHVVMHFGDGNTIDAWDSLEWKENFTEPLSDVTFEVRPPRTQFKDYAKRLRKGELVTILINGVNQGGFIINETDTTISDEGCGIRLSCHTPLITPYEGNVDPDLSLSTSTDVPVINAVLQAMRPYGFTRIVGDAAANVAAMSGKPLGGGQAPSITVEALKHRDAVAHQGETAYAFCSRIFTRLGCSLRVNAQGTLMVSAPLYEQAINDTLRQSFTGGVRGDYFIGEVKIHDSNAGQFSEYVVRGQRSVDDSDLTARPNIRITEAEIHPNHPSYSSTAAPYKPKYFKDHSSRDKARATNAAKLESGLRAAKAFHIDGEVDGFVSSTGRIWQTDMMVRVVIEASDIDEAMWILEVRRRQDSKGGQRTAFRLLPKGALVLGEQPS